MADQIESDVRPDTFRPPAWVTADMLARAVIMLFATSYGIGLIEVNVYLLQFGATDFTLARPGFILSGLLVLATVGCAITFTAFIVGQGKRLWRKPTWTERIVELLFLSSPVYIGAGVVLVLHISWVAIAVIIVSSLMVPAAIVSTIASISDWRPKWLNREALEKSNRDPRSFTISTGLGFVTFLLIAFLGVFSIKVLPHIPRQLGGASPIRVILVCDPEGVEALRSVGVPVTMSTTAPLNLIYELDRTYLIETASGAAVQIAKNDVTAIEKLQDQR